MNIIIEHYTNDSIPFLTRSAMALYVGQHSNVRYTLRSWIQIIPGDFQAYTLVYPEGQRSSARIITGNLRDTISDVRNNATQLGASRLNIDISIPGGSGSTGGVTPQVPESTSASGNNIIIIAVGVGLAIYLFRNMSKSQR